MPPHHLWGTVSLDLKPNLLKAGLSTHSPPLTPSPIPQFFLQYSTSQCVALRANNLRDILSVDLFHTHPFQSISWSWWFAPNISPVQTFLSLPPLESLSRPSSPLAWTSAMDLAVLESLPGSFLPPHLPHNRQRRDLLTAAVRSHLSLPSLVHILKGLEKFCVETIG